MASKNNIASSCDEYVFPTCGIIRACQSPVNSYGDMGYTSPSGTPFTYITSSGDVDHGLNHPDNAIVGRVL